MYKGALNLFQPFSHLMHLSHYLSTVSHGLVEKTLGLVHNFLTTSILDLSLHPVVKHICELEARFEACKDLVCHVLSVDCIEPPCDE